MSKNKIDGSKLRESKLCGPLNQSQLNMEEIENYANARLQKQEKYLEKVHRTELKKRETLQWQVMIEWLDEKLKEISKMLTRNH